MHQPTTVLSVQYVTDLSAGYPDLAVGIRKHAGQVVVVMDADTAESIAKVLIRTTETTDDAITGMTWIRAAIDMFTAAALAPLPPVIASQVGVLIDLPTSAADLDARDQANVTPHTHGGTDAPECKTCVSVSGPWTQS